MIICVFDYLAHVLDVSPPSKNVKIKGRKILEDTEQLVGGKPLTAKNIQKLMKKMIILY